MTEAQLLSLWGKTVRDKEGKCIGGQYHPLLFHLLDVGHVAMLLWDEVLSDRTKQAIAKALSLSIKDARDLIVMLAAVHDLGKACPAFQFQAFRGDGPAYLYQRMNGAGLKSSFSATERHSFISAKVLLATLARGKWQWSADKPAARILAFITGAHHGTFPSDSPPQYDREILGDAKWDEARQNLLDATWDALLPHRNQQVLRCGALSEPSLVPLVAGLISVADWLGSSHVFKVESNEDHCKSLSEYTSLSRIRAKQALHLFGWLPKAEISREPRRFEEIFPFKPNALQRQVETVAQTMDGPFFMIAESAMGSGKTEFSLFATDVALCRQIHNGLYLALPTQATSNALHKRVKDDYFGQRDHVLNLNVQLVHVNALLHSQQEIRIGEIHGAKTEGTADRDNRAAAENWFSVKKRPLLAPFGVGTIDQSLKGVLQTPHWFVRLFGLAGKVVIFDEVHSYDCYMSSLLARLVQWLRALDCSVILLSATLPRDKRHDLIRAWGSTPLEAEASYPRLTWIGNGAHQSIHIEDESDTKSVALCFESGDAYELSRNLRKKLAKGGCAAIVCNTVQQAQDVYEVMRQELSDLVEPEEFHLLHARLPFSWRQERERKILAKFGKRKWPRDEWPSGRPKYSIVVATSILQESLDLDFDYMISEMAPIDLLLQRLGRLFRHLLDENKVPVVRPPGLSSPEFVIWSEKIEAGTLPSTFGGFEDSVYDRYVLLRSWIALLGESAITIPDSIEPLIKKVYEDAAPNLGDDWDEALENAFTKLQKRRELAETKAEGVVISAPCDPHELVGQWSKGLEDEEDPQIHHSLHAATRDGRPSINLVCLCKTEGGLFLPDQHGHADLSHPVDLDMEPTLEQASDLLNASLPASDPGIYHQLRYEAAPMGWKKSPHLSFHRPIIFVDGVCHDLYCPVRLDDALGLIIDRKKQF